MRVASGPDNAGVCQYCQMMRVRQANRKGIRKEPAFTSPKWSPARTWRIRAGRGAHPPRVGRGTPGRGFSPSQGGHGEGLRRSRGDAAGTKSGASFDERSSSEHGNHPATVPGGGAASPPVGIGTSSAERVGWGGAVVVLRGRESRPHGEGRQRFREGGGCNAERRAAERRRTAGTFA